MFKQNVKLSNATDLPSIISPIKFAAILASIDKLIEVVRKFMQFFQCKYVPASGALNAAESSAGATCCDIYLFSISLDFDILETPSATSEPI